MNEKDTENKRDCRRTIERWLRKFREREMKSKLKKNRENKEYGTGEGNLKRENGIRSDDFGGK